jgi:hypothetical protein
MPAWLLQRIASAGFQLSPLNKDAHFRPKSFVQAHPYDADYFPRMLRFCSVPAAMHLGAAWELFDVRRREPVRTAGRFDP